MEYLREIDISTAIISGAVLAGTTLIIGVVVLRRRMATKSSKIVPNGVVLLHQFGRTRAVPNASPFCMKLETYLRMAKIPYENEFGSKFSKKGKVPWIEFNGQSVADSNFCVKFLNQEFGVDVNEHLDEQQRAIAHAFLTLVEENTVWTLAYYRFIQNTFLMKNVVFGFPWPLNSIIFWYVQKQIINQLHGHGMGRHSEAEIQSIAESDLHAVSSFLGEKKFFMGDKASLVDCSVFAIVANFLFQDLSSSQHNYIKEKLPNLVKYVNTMKEEFYPDWDELLRNGIPAQMFTPNL